MSIPRVLLSQSFLIITPNEISRITWRLYDIAIVMQPHSQVVRDLFEFVQSLYIETSLPGDVLFFKLRRILDYNRCCFGFSDDFECIIEHLQFDTFPYDNSWASFWINLEKSGYSIEVDKVLSAYDLQQEQKRVNALRILRQITIIDDELRLRFLKESIVGFHAENLKQTTFSDRRYELFVEFIRTLASRSNTNKPFAIMKYAEELLETQKGDTLEAMSFIEFRKFVSIYL